jgi:BTB/POZ domain
MSVTSSGVAPPGGGQGARYFSLRWNSHPVELVTGFTGLYQSETLVDVTLAAEGKHLQAHKMLLSACSDYFQSLFSINPCQHPIVILKDVNFDDLQTIVQVAISQNIFSPYRLFNIGKVCRDNDRESHTFLGLLGRYDNIK